MDKSLQIAGTTPNAPGTAVVGSAVNLAQISEACESLDVCAELIGATGGALDLYLQTSPDGGTTWYDYAHFTQLAAGAPAQIRRFGVSRLAQQTTITTIGKNLSPALAAGTVVGGPFGQQMRLVAVAGAGTSAGAAVTINICAQGTLGARN